MYCSTRKSASKLQTKVNYRISCSPAKFSSRESGVIAYPLGGAFPRLGSLIWDFINSAISLGPELPDTGTTPTFALIV